MSNLADMNSLGDADFTNFLVDLDLNFADALHVDQSATVSHGISAQQHQQNIDANGITSSDGLAQNGSLFDFAMPMDMQFPISHNGNLQHPTSNHGLIPPTPNSVEMHQNTALYMQQYEAHRVLMEQYQLKKHEAASFTPLVSPIVPAHEAQYDLPICYTVPGAYFSPLTSPALEGQQRNYQTAESSSSIATASPNDLDIDMQDALENPIATSKSTSSRKRPGVPRSATMIKARNSSTAKSMSKRKERSNLSISETSISIPVDQSSEHIWAPSPNLMHAPQTSGDSVSPEPLSEAMGPPQKPTSATASPAIIAKSRSRNSNGMPATPASYLKIQQAQSPSVRTRPQGPQRINSSQGQPLLTPLALPEAAATPFVLDEDSPVITSRKTPKLGPLSTPSGSVTPTANMTVTTPSTTIGSPLSTNFGPLSKKVDKSRSNRKRGSLSSNTLVSPALRPKISISPNIKPLLPEGATINDADAHTMFLASRSNYQNLIEGTHVPGVSYPQELSNNLTSKRTSHKIAEQGRRNRINLALQEMLHLLPRSASREDLSLKDDDSSPGGSGKKNDQNSKANGNSKAATVESAIEYIRTLKKEHEEMKNAKEKRDMENEELRTRLEAMEKLMADKNSNTTNGRVNKSSTKS